MSVSVLQGRDDGHNILDLFTFHRYSVCCKRGVKAPENIDI